MLARQHQGMDGAASRQDPETSRRQRRLEKDHQNICGAPTAPQRLRAADADADVDASIKLDLKKKGFKEYQNISYPHIWVNCKEILSILLPGFGERGVCLSRILQTDNKKGSMDIAWLIHFYALCLYIGVFMSMLPSTMPVHSNKTIEFKKHEQRVSNSHTHVCTYYAYTYTHTLTHTHTHTQWNRCGIKTLTTFIFEQNHGKPCVSNNHS